MKRAIGVAFVVGLMKKQKELIGSLSAFGIGMVFLVAVIAGMIVADTAAETNGDPQLRLAHLAPIAAGSGDSTEVYVSIHNSINEPVFGPSSIKYLDSFEYFFLDQGNYTLRVFPKEGAADAIVELPFTVSDDMDYTAVIIGGNSNQGIAAQINTDDNSAPAAGKAKMRLGHLSPFAEGAEALVDIRLQDGSPLAVDMPYGEIKDSYLTVDAGAIDLKITKPGGETTLIDLAPIALSDGDIKDVYAIGDVDNQPLGGYGWPSDAKGAALPLATVANLQFVHLGPLDDPLLSSTAITITLNNDAAVTNFEYGDSTVYMPYEEGAYNVKVFIEDNPYSISETIKMNAGMDYTLYFFGGTQDRVVEIDLITNNNAEPPAGKGEVRFGNLAPYLLDSRVDIREQDGTLIVGNLLYSHFTDYINFSAGVIDLRITTVGGQFTLTDPQQFTLAEGDISTLVVSGDANTQPLAAFYIPDGEVGAFLPEAPPGAASLEISKLPEEQDITIGDTANFTIKVTNTGAVHLTDVTVTDAKAPDCDKVIGDLAVGESDEYNCAKLNVTESFLNEVSVTGETFDEIPVRKITAQANAIVEAKPVPGTPGLAIQKTPDEQKVKHGETAEFSIKVTNTSDFALTSVAVSDAKAPDCDKNIGSLAAREKHEYSCSKANVTESFLNEAVVVGTLAGPPEEEISARSSAVVEVTALPGTPGLTILKTPDVQNINYKETANFTIKVKNSGTVPLTDVTVTDAQAPDCDKVIGSLAVGASDEYSCSKTTVTTSFLNKALVTGTAAGPPQVQTTAEDSAAVNMITRLIYMPLIMTK